MSKTAKQANYLASKNNIPKKESHTKEMIENLDHMIDDAIIDGDYEVETELISTYCDLNEIKSYFKNKGYGFLPYMSGQDMMIKISW